MRLLTLFLLTLVCAGHAYSAGILLVSNNQTPTGGDAVIKAALEANGHIVTMVKDSNAKGAYPANTIDNDPNIDILLLSSQVRSSRIGNTYKSLTKPILVWEAYLFDDLALTGPTASTDFGVIDNQASITLVGAHPMTAGLSGDIDIAQSSDLLRWGVPASEANISATILGDAGKAALFSYDSGAILSDGSAATGQRVGLFLGDDTAEIWTPEAELILLAAVNWVFTPGANTPPVVNAGQDLNGQVETGIALVGSVQDDGQLQTPVTEWTVVSAPAGAQVTITDTQALQTSATFSALGNYQLRLSADDGEFERSDTVDITIDDGSAPLRVLLVVGSLGGAADQNVAGFLQNSGYQVTLIDDNVVSPASANDQDIVIISSTVSSSKVGSKFTASALPVLVWEAWLYDDLKMAGNTALVDYGAQSGQTQVNIIPRSTLAGNLAAGPAVLSSSSDSYRWALPGAGAEIAATLITDPTRASFFGYAAGASLIDGSPAPGARIALPFGDVTASSWTGEAQTLLASALAWIGAEPVEPTNSAPIVTTGNSLTVTVNNEVALPGSVSDDGLSLPLSISWQVLDTPDNGSVNLTDPTSPSTSAVFDTVGTYELTLDAFDQEYSASATLSVTVVEESDKQALFVVGSVPARSGDDRVLDFLNMKGYQVEVVDDSLVTTASANGKNIIISSSVNSGAVGSKFTQSAIPLVTWESYIYDDLGLTGTAAGSDFGATSSQRSVLISSEHPVAAGRDGDTIIATNSNVMLWGQPNGNAAIVATLAGDSSKATIFTYDIGAELVNGLAAPARRVALHLSDKSPLSWTADSQMIFDAALNWAQQKPQASDTLRILALGDSITDGTGSTYSYRRYLWEDLQTANCAVDFSGSLYGPNVDESVIFDRDFEGHRGFQTGDIAANLSLWLEGNTPDIALIHLGTNDILGSADLNISKEHYRSIITSLRSASPSISIYLAKIIPGDSALEADVISWHALVEALAAEETSALSPVSIVDQYSGYSNDLHNQDDIHPNDSGDLRIANKWYDNIIGDIAAYCGI